MSVGESMPQRAFGIRLAQEPLLDVIRSEVTTPVHGGLRAWHHKYLRLLRVTDAAVIAGSVTAAQISSTSALGTLLVGGYLDSLVRAFVFVVLWSGALGLYRSRDSRVLGQGLQEYERVCTATLAFIGGVALVSSVLKLGITHRYLLAALFFGAFCLTLSRLLIRQWMLTRRKKFYRSSVLVIGGPDWVRTLVHEFLRRPEHGYTVVGVGGTDFAQCTKMLAGGLVDVPMYPCGEDVLSAVSVSGADTVVIASGYLELNQIRDLSWRLERLGVDMVLVPGFRDVSDPRLMIRPVGGLPLIHIDKPRYSSANRFGKRLFDMCLSVVLLLVAAPFMALVALAIKIEDNGPVFYTAARVGLDGNPFRMFKFRTMTVGADQRLADVTHLDEGNGVLFKIRTDPRVTRVGRFLRRYSIDEIPQFLNVLRRDMSVVGPRPPLESETSAYDDQMRRRLLVRPGITGLWQISGRSDLSWEESVRLDLSYVENWSMKSDFLIVAKTLGVVFRGSGAY